MNMRIKVGDHVKRIFGQSSPNDKHFVKDELYVVTDVATYGAVDKLSFAGKSPEPSSCFSSQFFIRCNPPENQAPLFEPRHFMKVFRNEQGVHPRLLRPYPLPDSGIPDKVQDEYGGGSYLFQEVLSDQSGRSQIVQLTQVDIPAPIPPPVPDPYFRARGTIAYNPTPSPRGRITYNPTPSPGYGPGEVGDYVLEKTVAPVDPKRYGVAQRRIK